MKFVKLWLIFMLVLAACTPIQPEGTAPAAPESPLSPESAPASTSESQQEPVTEGNLMGTQWILESYGPSGAETTVIGETPLTLNFSHDGQVTGSGGCNSFGGTYQVEDGTLVLGEIVSTLMACVDSELMEQERQYLDALQTVSTIELENDRLVLTYDQGVLNFSLYAIGTVVATPTPAPESSVPLTETESITGTDSITDQSQDTPQGFIWHCFGCGGNQVWAFEEGEATQIEIPIDIGVYYDYAPATDHILYGTEFPTQGGGPGMVSVTDLATYHMWSGEIETLFEEEVIVEAEWAPDGEALVYVLATDETYELRWRTLDGEDELLASDVAFTFGVSPTGEYVAFSRESNYEVGGQPGFYVVNVATGEETMISDVDRAGSGSIEDKPIWSPSGEHLLLPTHGIAENPDLLRAAVDGSDTVTLEFDPALSDEAWYDRALYNGVWIDETTVVGTVFLFGPDSPMGGVPTVILYQLNEALDTIVAGETITEGMLVDQDHSGTSVWVQVDAEMQNIPLPPL